MPNDALPFPIPMRFNTSHVIVGRARIPIVVRLDDKRTNKYQPLTGSIYFGLPGCMLLGFFRPFSNGLAIVRVIEVEDFELDSGETLCYIPRPSKAGGKQRIKTQHGTMERVRLAYSEELYNEDEENRRLQLNESIAEKLIKRDKKIGQYVKGLAERKRIEKEKNGLDGINTGLSFEELERITETQQSFLSRGKRHEIA